MELISDRHPLTIVVGSGGVGKTTLAAAMGVLSARSGRETLVLHSSSIGQTVLKSMICGICSAAAGFLDHPSGRML